jgi:class 3 adenylate cyclase
MLALEAIGIEAIAGCMAGALIARGRRMGLRRRRRRMARHPSPTFVFADLVGYTSLTEKSGDEAAADVAREFRRAMLVLSREHGAWHVKSMGDGAMIWVPDAGSAVRLAERTLTEVGLRPDLLPVRIGAHTGPAVMRDGDWYGNAVNVAARLADMAGPNEAVVSDATQSIADDRAQSALCCREEVGLRGVARPIVVWRMGPNREQLEAAAGTDIPLAAGPVDIDPVGRMDGLLAVPSGFDHQGAFGLRKHSAVPGDTSGVAAAESRAV